MFVSILDHPHQHVCNLGTAMKFQQESVTWGLSRCVCVAAGVQFDQNELAVKLGDIQLMQAGQPLAFDAKTASTYLKDTCAKHGTVNIYVTIGKGAGKGEVVT